MSSFKHKKNIPSVSLKIDLSRLINLKWIDLRFIKGQNENNLELITDSYNQLTKVRVEYTTIDFSKQLDLTELKCLNISNVDLSQQICKQWFYSMISLIELNLSYTNLINVDFLDSDRLENLEILDLSNNQITTLKKGAFNRLNKLKMLFLSDNQIEELILGVFEGLECLEELSIISNNINVESINKTVFDGLNCLKSLFVRNFKMENVNVDYLKRDGLNIYF